MGRPVPGEIVAAVREGWFCAGARALDVGCGQGDVAAWLGGRGFQALGIDFAKAAIRRARAVHGEKPGRLAFRTMDICGERPPPPGFEVVVDRGCFHGIPPAQTPQYVRNVSAACTATTRFLLFQKAFRDDRPVGDSEELERHVARVHTAFAGEFNIERVGQTYLDPFDGSDRARALPGVVFWMTRAPRAAPGDSSSPGGEPRAVMIPSAVSR